MNSRKIKQIIYGAGYLAVLGLILVGVYFLWFQPAPTCFDNKQNGEELGVDCGGPTCEPCEKKNLSPLFLSDYKYFSASDSKTIAANTTATILLLEITNPNQNYAAQKFDYSINIYGKDSGQIKNITGSSYIYSGEIKRIVETTDINIENISEIKMSFSVPDWQPKTAFTQPELQKRQIIANDSATQNNGLIVSGLITNNNAYDLSLINIVSVVFNKDGKAISAAQTILKNVSAFREMPFSINFPKNISLVQEEAPAAKVYTFTRDLTLGMTGDDVLQLETFLKNNNYFTNTPDTYFGTATKAAIIKYQQKVGISPAAGYFGGKTRADINALAAKPASVALNPNQADPIKTEVYVEGIR